MFYVKSSIKSEGRTRSCLRAGRGFDGAPRMVSVSVHGEESSFIHLSNGFRCLCGNKLPVNMQIAVVPTEKKKCLKCFSMTTSDFVWIQDVLAPLSPLLPCNFPVIYSSILNALIEEVEEFIGYSYSTPNTPMFEMEYHKASRVMHKIKSKTTSLARMTMNRKANVRRGLIPLRGGERSVIDENIVIDGSEESINAIIRKFNLDEMASKRASVRMFTKSGYAVFLSAGTLYYCKAKLGPDKASISIDVLDQS